MVEGVPWYLYFFGGHLRDTLFARPERSTCAWGTTHLLFWACICTWKTIFGCLTMHPRFIGWLGEMSSGSEGQGGLLYWDHSKLKKEDDTSHPSHSVRARPPRAPFNHPHFSMYCGGPLWADKSRVVSLATCMKIQLEPATKLKRVAHPAWNLLNKLCADPDRHSKSIFLLLLVAIEYRDSPEKVKRERESLEMQTLLCNSNGEKSGLYAREGNNRNDASAFCWSKSPSHPSFICYYSPWIRQR